MLRCRRAWPFIREGGSFHAGIPFEVGYLPVDATGDWAYQLLDLISLVTCLDCLRVVKDRSGLDELGRSHDSCRLGWCCRQQCCDRCWCLLAQY